MKTIFTTIALLILPTLCLAESCPDIKTIKSNTLTGWTARDSDDGKPLNAKRTAFFKKNIEQFTLAEWVTDGKQKGNMHCYYSDKNGSGLEAYLTKESFRPNNLKHYWYQVSGSMHCAAGMGECLFQQINLSNQPHLAKK